MCESHDPGAPGVPKRTWADVLRLLGPVWTVAYIVAISVLLLPVFVLPLWELRLLWLLAWLFVAAPWAARVIKRAAAGGAS